MRYPSVLSIAGSDSGGGAGIQADIKAISATGSYAACAITAITAQNTLGVKEVFPVPVPVVCSQIRAVLEDITIDAVKIGMLYSADAIDSVAGTLSEFESRSIVLDPVMVSTSGHRLIEEDAVRMLVCRLFPLCRVITPNIPEAEALTGMKICSSSDLRKVAEALFELARTKGKNPCLSILLKGGHLESDCLLDLFFNAETGQFIEFSKPRTDTVNTHGTGCTLSSALASFLAQGKELDEAVRLAETYISKAISSAVDYETGHGHGPVNHFYGQTVKL